MRLGTVVSCQVALLLALTCSPLLVSPAAADSDTPIDLFQPVSSFTAQQSPTLSPDGLRGRYVELNPAALAEFSAEKPAEIRLSFFPGATYISEISEKQDTPTGGSVLTGSLVDIPDSEVIFSLQDGVLIGGINLPDPGNNTTLFYQIKPAGEGSHLYQVEQLDPQTLPEEAGPLDPPSLTEGQTAPETPSILGASADGDPVIDVLVVYDTDAMTAMGGQSATTARINQLITETNLGYANSQIHQRVVLVGQSWVDYNEAIDGPNLSWQNTLQRLTNTSDGILDGVHTLRNQVGADLVVFLIDDMTYCGLAWVLPPSVAYAPWGFSVVSAACTSAGSYSFAHEMGHNMGAQHDRINAGSSTGAYPYSFGYQEPSRAFRTIMAYNCAGGCPRINYWSNPAVNYNGKPTGVDDAAPDSADNTHTLNNTAGFVSAFRAPQVPDAPVGLSATAISETRIDLAWSDNNQFETGYKVWRAEGLGNAVLVASLPANTTQYNDTSALCGKAYTYTVTASNTSGDSGQSDPASASTQACSLPASPQNLRVWAISNHSVMLTWSDVSNEHTYQVQRKLPADPGWTVVAADLPANTTTFLDSGLLEHTLYSYRITAVNTAGSMPSQVQDVTTVVYPIYLPQVEKNP